MNSDDTRAQIHAYQFSKQLSTVIVETREEFWAAHGLDKFNTEQSIAFCERLLHAEWNLSVDAAIDAEADAQAICMQTEDFRRAYRAFAAKQKPQFQGN